MSKAKYLFYLAVSGFISLLMQGISGLVLWFALPRGGGQGGGGSASTFIWERSVWVAIHDWCGVAFLVIIVIHLYLHRKWLWRQTKNVFKRQKAS